MTVTSYIVLAVTLFALAHAAGWSHSKSEKWGENFAACKGNKQSPIHIESDLAKYDNTLVGFKLSGYGTSKPHEIVNNGHTVQLNIDYAATAKEGALPGTFKALQFHFHWSGNDTNGGSEHMLNKKAYPLEVHIVHMNTKYATVTEALKHGDGLAVLGFFYEIGPKNAALDTFLKSIPAYNRTGMSASLSLTDLIGPQATLGDYFRYEGSLTTPPCSEAVVWTVFSKPLTLSNEQLDVFWKLRDSHGHMYANYRPIQKLNGRSVYTSVKSSGMMSTAISGLVLFSTLLSANLW